jgi:hypothetical protein
MGLIQKGLPKSAMEGFDWLLGGGILGLIVFGLSDSWIFRRIAFGLLVTGVTAGLADTGLRQAGVVINGWVIFGASAVLGIALGWALIDLKAAWRTVIGSLIAVLVAALIDASVKPLGIRIDGWAMFCLSMTLGITLAWGLEESPLVRRWFFGGLVVSILYPFTVIVLPQMPLIVRLLLALAIAGAIGAWAGWRVWPAIEGWHRTAWNSARTRLESAMEWRRASAVARGEVSAEDFLKGRKKR